MVLRLRARVGNLASLQERPVLRLAIDRGLLKRLLWAAGREVAGAPTDADVHLHRSSYLRVLQRSLLPRQVGSAAAGVNHLALGHEPVGKVDAPEHLAGVPLPYLVILRLRRSPRHLDGFSDANKLQVFGAVHVVNADLDEHGALLRCAAEVQRSAREDPRVAAIGRDEAPWTSTLVQRLKRPDSAQLPVLLLVHNHHHQSVGCVVARVWQVRDLVELEHRAHAVAHVLHPGGPPPFVCNYAGSERPGVCGPGRLQRRRLARPTRPRHSRHQSLRPT
mmetsp:Transcript_13062/g.36123  ORF Transcript_13062/g.36123 Transcript_13062/m.36123 type:complete len:277 (-) Transcript_13062:575-1405(-)